MVELRPAPGGGSVLAVSGALDVTTASAARSQIEARLADARPTSLEVDASGIEGGDTSGMAVLEELRRGRYTSGMPVPVRGLPPRSSSCCARFLRRRPWPQRPRSLVLRVSRWRSAPAL